MVLGIETSYGGAVASDCMATKGVRVVITSHVVRNTASFSKLESNQVCV